MRVGVTVRPRELVAVLVDGSGVRARTTAPVPRGGGLRVPLRRALRRLTQATPGADGAPPGGVHAVTVDAGALLDHALAHPGPEPVAVLRLARPHGSICPPLYGWGSAWQRAAAPVATVSGGYDLFGVPLAGLDRAGVRSFAARMAGVADRVAITAAGAVLSGGHEVAAADLIGEVAPGAVPVLSHRLGGLGLAYRENATILSAALRPFADDVSGDCQQALQDLRLTARLGFVLGAGALASPEHWRAFPARALGATSAAVLTGAGVLAGVENATMVDWGGQEYRVGQLVGGWPVTEPRQALPDGPVVSVPAPGVRRVPPADLGRDSEQWPRQRGPVVLVVPGDGPEPPGGDRATCRVDRDIAAAVGAAVARPAVTLERLVPAGTPEQLDAALAQTRADALAELVTGGADPGTTEVRDAHVAAVAYLAGTVRVRVHVVGRLSEVGTP